MKVQLKELVNAVPTIQHLAGEKVSVPTACDLFDIVGALKPSLDTFDQVKAKLFEEYGEDFEGGRRIEKEHVEAFTIEMNELLEREIELNITPIDPARLEKVELTFQEIGAIRFIFPRNEEGPIG
jgi:hypothetical protein